jgi:hypothetical protein
VVIERFVWTEHAEARLRQRQLDAAEVEQAIKKRHSDREANDGTVFEAIYDHPHSDDEGAVRIVSVWRVDS